MKRTVILVAAGLAVAAASVSGAIAVLQNGPSTIDAMCVEQDETDRDKAGLVDHVTVVTVDQNPKVKQEDPSSAAYLTSRVHVEETLKGTVPTAATVEQAVNVTPTGAYQAAAPHQQPLLPGHRYVIGVQDWPGYDGQIWFATNADGLQLQSQRARWQDAVAHQNPPRTHEDCKDSETSP
ncbi:hypothetical protein [Streptomyces sp. NPDC093111]|uniref:hypothetical protein n=1 Tax=Streptomyces sp. NPDC093111 TaxID=3154978 RepID=UPI0034352175